MWTGEQVFRREVEEKSRRVASGLVKRGFSRGHVLYYVTHEMARIYLAHVAVWRLGGAVWGFAGGDSVGMSTLHTSPID